MDKGAKIYIAGHRGLVGSAITQNLKNKGYANLVFRNHSELDLTDAAQVNDFFRMERPEYVFLAAAKVGGIVANNTYRADFIYENLMIQNNVIHNAHLYGVKKLLFLGSTCIYPKACPQPMKEEYLLTDVLEYTNEPYAMAKIAGIKMCESYNLQYNTNFTAVMPTNLYGPNDNFDLEKSHVLPALIRKMHLGKLWKTGFKEAVLEDLGLENPKDVESYLTNFGITENSVEIWGSGKPMREFLWSEDMADACVFLMKNRDFSDTFPTDAEEIRNTHINIGTGKDISIRDLAFLVKNIVGYEGELVFNTNRPDGTFRKLTDVSKLESLGWKYTTDLKTGIDKLYKWYLETSKNHIPT